MQFSGTLIQEEYMKSAPVLIACVDVSTIICLQELSLTGTKYTLWALVFNWECKAGAWATGSLGQLIRSTTCKGQ